MFESVNAHTKYTPSQLDTRTQIIQCSTLAFKCKPGNKEETYIRQTQNQ